MIRVLVVCLGNMCRSPMAEVLLRDAIAKDPVLKTRDIDVRSAGVRAWEGTGATTEASQAVQVYGLDLTGHRATRLTPELASWADVILAMEESHGNVVVAQLSAAAAKTHLISVFAGAAGEIADPFGEPQEVYDQCAREIAGLLPGILDRLRRDAS